MLTSEIFSVTIPGTPLLNSPTSFDGKYVWITTGDAGAGMSVHIIDFWGPYIDEDNSHYLRWAEIIVDDLTIGNLGPKLKLVKTIVTGKVIKQMHRREIGVTTLLCNDYTQIRISEQTLEILSSTVVSKPVPDPIPLPQNWTTPFLDENGVFYSPLSKWFVNSTTSRNYQETPEFFFTVGPAKCEQMGPDQQNLYWHHLTSGAYVGHTLIPGRKQQSVRYICYLSGKIFVGAFNEACVYVYDSATGAFIIKLNVNRDVEEMFVFENTIYVTSRNGLFSKITATLDVSDYGNGATRDFYVNLVDQSYTTPSPIPDNTFWEIEPDVAGKFDGGSTVWSLDTTGSTAIYFRKDNRQGKKFNLFSPYKSVAYVPALTYQYFVDGNLTTVVVPPHLILAKANTVHAIRFPNLYKGNFNKTFGGVMAISTGPLHYKGDAI